MKHEEATQLLQTIWLTISCLLVFSNNRHHHPFTRINVVSRGCLCHLLPYAAILPDNATTLRRLMDINKNNNTKVVFDVSRLDVDTARRVRECAERMPDVSVVEQEVTKEEAMISQQEFAAAIVG